MPMGADATSLGGTKGVNLLQAYQRHITSDHLQHRWPYLEDIRAHLKEDDVTTAYGDRLFPRLLEQLKNPDMAPEKLIEALRTVWGLCSHQENKCQAIAADAVAAATDLLMHEHVPVRRDAARVISSVALMIAGRSLMPAGNASRKFAGALGGGATLPRLAKLLLGCNDELVKMHVAEALRSITIFRDGCQQTVDQGGVKGIAQYLCGTLPDMPSSNELGLCLLHLLYTLAAVTMYARDGMRDLFNVGLIGRLVRFLDLVPRDTGVPAVGQEDSTDILRQGLRLLWHTGNDAQGRKETLEAEGVRVISEYLDSPDPKVREASVCALNVASLETQGKKDVLLNSMERLARLLHSEDETPYLHETCVQLCRSASELPAFRFAFARHVLKSIWLLEKIYSTTALAAISPLLEPKESDETRVQAVHVMLHFLQRNKPGDGDKTRVPPVCPLRNVHHPPMFALEECTDLLHNLIAVLPLAQDAALECLDCLTEARRPREILQQILENGRATLPEAVKLEVEDMLNKEDEV